MARQRAIAIFDIGKTNKKLFVFNEQYRIVFEKTTLLEESTDEDGFPCENLDSLSAFVTGGLREVLHHNVELMAVNFSAYGASFVHVGDNGKPITPLYNYLKPYPEYLLRQFYDAYGGEETFANETASPVLGSLNSGMQLYRIKYEQPQLFQKIRHAFHLPQYLSYLICGGKFSDLTSIGCHTNLWNFRNNNYHEWVTREGIVDKLLPISTSDTVIPSTVDERRFTCGIGLHDSSAALIPYLSTFPEPFILISTGTWCITLNPFNNSPLTKHELKNDCLCYLQYDGKPVKAARLFAGYMHDEQVNRIADFFHTDKSKYKNISYDDELRPTLQKDDWPPALKNCAFENRELSLFSSDIQAYHQLIFDLVSQQVYSTKLVLCDSDAKQIFVDGGFSKNEIYMNFLASAFPQMRVYATSMAQATAIGAALVIHQSWNGNSLPDDIVKLKEYTHRHRPVE